MGTVRVDRYRVRCAACGFEKEFMVGAGMGDIHAAERGADIHAEWAPQGCDGALARVERVKQ